MSRRGFRIDVEEPRPTSAWVLVVVASATLWITQQLAVWVVAVQIAFLGLSFATRKHPPRWQQHPLALNIGMLFIVIVTIRVALQGHPSTIALANFAALTQALQLVDTRPRRTEFLLVALALFQVVLASNLTDSVFFPPLLIGFVFAAVWTLIVHTLRCEALEAGDRAAASQAITPGVLKMTLFATAASVVLALVLFVVLPRLRSSVVTGSGLGPVTATSGFSDTVALGELGSIRQDPTVVMRVETTSGDVAVLGESYWRGLAFDHFDGRSWSITPPDRFAVPGSVESGISFGWNPGELNLVQTVVREPVESGVIFAIGDKRSLQGNIHRLENDVNGGLYARGQSHERVRYTIASQTVEWRDSDLEHDLAVAPRGAGERYYQLPELPAEVAQLAHEITKGSQSDAERARALEGHLISNGRYSDTPPTFDSSAGGSALEHFLFQEMAAHCEYYASALVVLARSIGLPARLVNGFAGGHLNRIGGFIEVRRSDAHAWVEVHFEGAGWVRYDATPPDLRSRAGAPASLDERFRELASAMELWWFQRVVGFDRSDQIHAVKRAVIAWREAKAGSREDTGVSIFARWRGLVDGRWREGLILALCFAGSGIVIWRLRPAPRRKELPEAYAVALRLLARRGIVRQPSDTAREFGTNVRTALPAVAETFDDLTECYLRERFGGRPDIRSKQRLKQLREELSAA